MNVLISTINVVVMETVGFILTMGGMTCVCQVAYDHV